MAREALWKELCFEFQSGEGCWCVEEEEQQMQRPEVGMCTFRWLRDSAVWVCCGEAMRIIRSRGLGYVRGLKIKEVLACVLEDFGLFPSGMGATLMAVSTNESRREGVDRLVVTVFRFLKIVGTLLTLDPHLLPSLCLDAFLLTPLLANKPDA